MELYIKTDIYTIEKIFVKCLIEKHKGEDKIFFFQFIIPLPHCVQIMLMYSNNSCAKYIEKITNQDSLSIHRKQSVEV